MNKAADSSSTSSEIVTISDKKQKILDFIESNGCITESQIMELVNVKKTRAYSIAKEMCAEGLLKTIGRGSSKKYVKA